MFKKLDSVSRDCVRVLLSERPHALQILRACYWFNFESPFYAQLLHGSFTVGQLEKIARARVGGSDAFAVVLVRDGARAHIGCSWSDFKIVSLPGGGRFDIEFPHDAIYKYNTGRERAGLDYFFRKSDFNDVRKLATAEAFLIVQRADYMGASEKLAPAASDRFYAVSDSYETKIYTSAANSARVVRRVKVRDVRPNDVIDKSGYLLQDRRADLRRRAAALRADRQRAAFLGHDWSGEVEKLADMVISYREKCLQTINAAASYADIKEALKMFNSYSSGLEWIMYEFETFVERVRDGKYTSFERCRADYEKLFNKLSALLKGGAADVA